MPSQKTIMASLPKHLSRETFRTTKGGGNRAIPQFQLESFAKDLKKLFLETESFEELNQNVLELNKHYIWKNASLGIIYRKSEADPFEVTKGPSIDAAPILLDDLDLNNDKSVASKILESKQAAYIPDTAFERCLDFYQLPENMHELLKRNKAVDLVAYKDVKANKLDLTSMQKKISVHSRSLFLMPLRVGYRDVGVFAIGYPLMFTFSDPLDLRHVEWLYMLGEISGLTVEKILSSK